MANYAKKAVKAEDTVSEVVVEKEVVKTPVAPAKPVKKQIDRDAMVACRNVTIGGLTYVSKKTGMTTEWANYGDEEWLDVGELLTMKGGQPRFLTEPWLVIDDEDVVEYLGLKNIYDSIIPVDEIEDFLYSGADNIKAVLQTAPKGTKELVKDKAREMIVNETLYDIRVIKLLEKELQVDLEIFQD